MKPTARLFLSSIAAGYATPEEVVAGWMNSPGHRENILSPNFTEMGVGMTSGGGKFGTYWAQEFGARPNFSASSPPSTDYSADDGSDQG